MRRFGVLVVVMGITLLAAPSRAPAQQSSERPVVYEVALTGPIDPLLARYAERAISRAQHDWAERAVRQSVSVSASAALRLHVIDLEATSRSALFGAVDGRTVRANDHDVVLHLLGARVVQQHPTLAEGLLHDIVDPNVAYLFFILGLISLAAFVIHPGVHVTALVALLLLVASLISFGMLPVTIAGLVLLVAGVVFSVVGLKVHGRGLPEVAAITCLILGGLFLFDPSVPNAHVSIPLIIAVAVGDTLFFFFVMRAVLNSRYTPVRSGPQSLIGAP